MNEKENTTIAHIPLNDCMLLFLIKVFLGVYETIKVSL